MKISAIIPVLNEERNLWELYERLVSTLESYGETFEIIFSDDGSGDRTPEILRSISSADGRVKVVTLPGNLGQHRAILAGFEESRGEIVVTLDGDLQNHPEDIPRLVDELGQGYDVAAGWRRARRDRFHRKLISWVLSHLASTLSGVRLRDYGCMLRAYRRWVFEQLSLWGERSVFIPTFVNRFGVRVTEVEVGHSPRRGGRSKYGLLKLFRLYSDLISDFSLFSLGSVRALGSVVGFGGSPREPRGSREDSLRTCVLAYGEIGYVCLEELIRQGEEIVALVTQSDDPEEHIWFRSVRELAARNRIPAYKPEDVNNPQFMETLKSLKPELILSFTFRQILAREILSIPSRGCFNLHPSLLPKYRGRCPANWVLINGEEKTGVSLHHMEERADSGDIVGQVEVGIDENDTIMTLYDKLARASVELLRETLPKIRSGKAEGVPQREEEATYFGGRKPEDGKIDWKRSAQEVYNLIRAVTHPYPGAFFSGRKGEKIFCWKAEPDDGKGKPGEVLEVRRGEGVLVSCAEGALLLQSLQFEDGRELRGDELARKLGLEEGAILT